MRVFDGPPADDAYTILNVTDTQVSVGAIYASKTQTQLREFVDYVNASDDPSVTRTAFITFNGDLHNGGSPGGLRQRYVSTTYQAEATATLDALKRLRFPIFLTAGNHDGYVATGQVPKAVTTFDAATGESLEKVVRNASPTAWPGMTWEKYNAYRTRSASIPGGWHRDLFAGRYVRRAGVKTFGESYLPVREDERNVVLYDGFYQWRRTYGPLYAGWSFGRNHFMSLNTYDLRQHRRSGWGMYTVNYGGGISPIQAEWIARELAQAESKERDVVLLGHHDPRGGHKGKDFGYYFAHLDYHGIGQSALNYLNGKVTLPIACNLVPDWATSASLTSDCVHDGLQEWHRADEEFDCADDDRLPDGACDQQLFDTTLPEGQRRAPWYSGYDLLDKVARNPSVRTILLVHTHYNSLELFQSGEALVPDLQAVDAAHAAELAKLEVQNPIRGFSWIAFGGDDEAYDPATLAQAGLVRENGLFFLKLGLAAQRFERTVQGPARELAIMRLTSNADLANQTYQGKSMMGFSTLEIRRQDDARRYALPQINDASFFINRGKAKFDRVRTVPIDRTASVRKDDPSNPVGAGFVTE